MVSVGGLPSELQFLSEIFDSREIQYREAKWRTNSFDEDTWTTDCGFEIDFHVRLDDGALLTERCHRSLLEVFKTWLCVQGHFDSTGDQLLGAAYIQTRVRQTLHLIDYFLLNADRFQLARYGLLNITENDLNGLFMELVGSGSIANSIYCWPQRLELFLRSKGQTLDQAEVLQLIDSQPLLLSCIPERDERMLKLSDEEIIRARAWLWKCRFYRAARGEKRQNPNTKMLAIEIFADTLAGKVSKPVPDELRLDATPGSFREYPAAPVTHGEEDRMSDLVLTCYLAALRRMGLLEQLSLPVPAAALGELDKASLTAFLEPRKLGRYRNLPQEVVFSSLRNSIEFSLQYGEDLIDSYLSVAQQARLVGLPCRSYCSQNDMRPLLTPKLLSLGVRRWTIDDEPKKAMPHPESTARHNCFGLLRANVGLWELLRVLYGSAQICVGTLMARRSGELRDLVAGRCLDKSMTRLVFFNRKSGVAEMREKEARPIPTVAVKLIRLLERLQTGLIEIGELSKYTSLFVFPSHSGTGLVRSNCHLYNNSLDLFCDYFETPLNRKGERYYIRQHQLRRFFAMLFFWGGAFGGMETLRWFLGHTDIRHLYHYITESVGGTMLRSVKAIYAAEQIAAHTAEAERLADLLQSHFGTRDFSVLDSEELAEYVEDLLSDGTVSIEPVFFDTPQGTSYRILIVVSAKGGQIETR